MEKEKKRKPAPKHKCKSGHKYRKSASEWIENIKIVLACACFPPMLLCVVLLVIELITKR